MVREERPRGWGWGRGDGGGGGAVMLLLRSGACRRGDDAAIKTARRSEVDRDAAPVVRTAHIAMLQRMKRGTGDG